jgi:glyoxylase-like metal-dependent hydrolase (beta-lactamase superfamily II)
VADITQMVSGWQRLRQLASAPQYIIPGHDPMVMQCYPEAEPALRGIAVRLDVDPRSLT